MARLPITPSNGARITVKDRSRSALASAVCELLQRARGLLLLRLEHVDVGDRRLDRGLARPARRPRPGRGWPAPARASARLLIWRVARSCWRFSSRSARWRRPWRRRAAPWPARRPPAGRRSACRSARWWPAARRSGRARSGPPGVVAVVDAGDDVAGLDLGVVLDGNVGDVARDLGRQRRVPGADVGVVGRHHVAAGRPPGVAEIAPGAQRQQAGHAGDDAQARAPAKVWPRWLAGGSAPPGSPARRNPVGLAPAASPCPPGERASSCSRSSNMVVIPRRKSSHS